MHADARQLPTVIRHHDAFTRSLLYVFGLQSLSIKKIT